MDVSFGRKSKDESFSSSRYSFDEFPDNFYFNLSPLRHSFSDQRPRDTQATQARNSTLSKEILNKLQMGSTEIHVIPPLSWQQKANDTRYQTLEFKMKRGLNQEVIVLQLTSEDKHPPRASHPDMEANIPRPDSHLKCIYLNETCVFHYYNSFEKTVKSLDLNPKNYPHLAGSKNLITIENKKKNVVHILALKSSHSSSEERKKTGEILENLIFLARFSKIGLKQHMASRFRKLIWKAFKRCIGFLGKSLRIEDSSFSETLEDIGVFLKEIRKEKTLTSAMESIKEELKSIMYKTVIQEGLFPFKFEFNTMNFSFAKVALINLFAPSNILPWGADYHVSMNIGNYRYSFVDRGEVKNQEEGERFYQLAFSYHQLKILDFFPLDEWIESFSGELEKIFTFEFVTDLIMQSAMYLERGRLNDKEALKIILGLSPDEEEYFDTEFDYNRELDAEKKLESFNTKRFLQKVIKDKLNSEVLRKISKEECLRVSENLIELYYEQFYSKGFFRMICKVIAETELRQYSVWDNNCQTPVSEVIDITNKVFGNFIECLTFDEKLAKKVQEDQFPMEKDYERAKSGDFLAQKFVNYFKFASRVTYNIACFIPPCDMTERLDFFSFYADEQLKNKMTTFKNNGRLFSGSVFKRRKNQTEKMEYLKSESFLSFEEDDKINQLEGLTKQQSESFKFIRNNICKEYFEFFTKSGSSESQSNITIKPLNLSNLIPSQIRYSSGEPMERKSNGQLAFSDFKHHSQNFNESRKPTLQKMASIFREPRDGPEKRNSSSFRFFPRKPEDSDENLGREPKRNGEMSHMSFLIFCLSHHLLNLQKFKDNLEIDDKMKPEEYEFKIRRIKKQKFWTRIFLSEFYYFYYNSIRAQMVHKKRPDMLTYVGHLLVKGIK